MVVESGGHGVMFDFACVGMCVVHLKPLFPPIGITIDITIDIMDTQQIFFCVHVLFCGVGLDS